jgi:hypothetical protein
MIWYHVTLTRNPCNNDSLIREKSGRGPVQLGERILKSYFNFYRLCYRRNLNGLRAVTASSTAPEAVPNLNLWSVHLLSASELTQLSIGLGVRRSRYPGGVCVSSGLGHARAECWCGKVDNEVDRNFIGREWRQLSFVLGCWMGLSTVYERCLMTCQW